MVKLRQYIEHVGEQLGATDLTLSRFVVALGSLTWAVILLAFGSQFDRPSYVHLAAVAPQWVWGVLFAIVGVLQFTRVTTGVRLSSGFYACTVAGLIAWLWCAVTTALALSVNPPPAMVSGNVAIAIISVVIFIRTVARRD